MALDIKHDPVYYEKDPDRKGKEWGAYIVSALRLQWQHIIDPAEAKKGMEILTATQDLKEIKKGFKKGKDFTENNKWIPIAIFDSIVNILTAEFLKAAYTPFVEATDVSADLQRKNDETLLAGRPIIEQVMSDLGQRVGNPPYQVPPDKFNGNVQMFDQMGLSDKKPEDIFFFMRNLHRLKHEVDARELCVSLMKHNKFENYVEDIVRDILAKKALAYQVFDSPNTGEIKWRYIDPLVMKAIKGESKDFSDAPCLGYEKNVTVRQFLEFAGPEFEFERDGAVLANAINVSNGFNFITVTRDGCIGLDEKGSQVLMVDRQSMYKFMVGVGYMEFRTVDEVVKKEDKSEGLLFRLSNKDRENNVRYTTPITMTDPMGNVTTVRPPVQPTNKQQEKYKTWFEGKYSLQIREFQKIYKTWYLSTGLSTQYIFRYGPLYHMLSFGAYDEFVSYSLKAYVGGGKSAVQISETFVDVANMAFQKMLWAIYESSPRIRVLNYDSMVQLVAKLKPTVNRAPGDLIDNINGNTTPKVGIENQLDSILSHYTESLVHIFTTPEYDGQKMPGQKPAYWDEGGVDPLAPAMQTVLEWAEAQIKLRLGINPLREAYAPDPKDGYKVGMESLKQSRNATYYIPWMIDRMLTDISTSSLSLAQDAIEFKQTPTYGFIETLIGEDAIETFKSLDKIPLHRYAIYVDIFNGEDRKNELKQEAFQAYLRKDITYDQYLIVKEIDDYKKAGMILAYYRDSNDKKLQEQATLQHQRALDLENLKTSNQISLIEAKGKWALAEETERGKYYMAGQQTPANAAIIKKQMDIDNNAKKLEEKADAEIRVKQQEADIANQRPLPLGVPGLADLSQGGGQTSLP